MGLKTPTVKTASKVISRSSKGITSNFKPFNPSSIAQGSKSPEAHFRNLKAFQKKFPEANAKKLEKDMRNLNRIFKGFEVAGKIADKTVKTMGTIKNLSPYGLAGAIMTPSKVGDATLTGVKSYKRMK